MMTAMRKSVLTSKQAADLLGCSVSTISRMVADGRLTPVLRIEGLRGPMFFDADDIAAAAGQQEAS